MSIKRKIWVAWLFILAYRGYYFVVARLVVAPSYLKNQMINDLISFGDNDIKRSN